MQAQNKTQSSPTENQSSYGGAHKTLDKKQINAGLIKPGSKEQV